MTGSMLDARARYRIRVAGRLGGPWDGSLDEMTVVRVDAAGPTGATDVTGWATDQAALMGILQELYSLGATLLSVERLEGEVESEDRVT